MRGIAVRVAAAAGLSALAFGAVVAEPLPKEECEKLQVEQAALDKAGVKDALMKGAAWGRTNLGREQLKQVERYITIEESLSFRCGLARARLTLPFAEEDHPPTPPEDAKGEPAASVPPAKPKPKPKPKAAAKETDPVPQAATATQAPPDAAKPKPKPKAEAKTKPDDAYRPPAPANPGADPFAKQPAAVKPQQ